MWLREKPSCEGNVTLKFLKSSCGSSSDAVDRTAHRYFDNLARDTFLCSLGMPNFLSASLYTA